MMNWFQRTIWPPLPVWKKLDLSVITVIVYSFIVEILFDIFQFDSLKFTGELGIVNAVLLGVLLGFRNTHAYDRWWEARKLWGQLINDSRNFAIKARTFAKLGMTERLNLGSEIHHFAMALKYHLRGRRFGSPLPDFVPPGVGHSPIYVAQRCYGILHGWRAENRISDFEFLMLDPHAKAFMDISGACERIQNTPVPLSYRSLLRHGTVIYLLSAPWFLASQPGYWGVVVVSIIAYFLLGTELTAETIEDPFGPDGDDLELSKYCETIRLGVSQALDVDVPPVIRDPRVTTSM